MTSDVAAPVTRERRLANLRATLARSGGAPAGPDQEPARAPFAGRRSPVLAARLAAALGADVAEDGGALLVQRVVPPVEIPVDRERLARLPGHPPADAPLVCLDTETTGLATAAGTLAFLVGLARWEGAAFHQTQLLLPDHADEPALLAEIARWVTPDAWLVTYNGRGFDWPLIEARYRLAGRAAPAHAGHLDLLPFVRRVFRHRMENARLRSVETELLGRLARRATSRAGRSRRSTSTCCGAGRSGALAGVVIHNEKDVRSLGLLLAHVEHRYADRAARHEAPARRPGGPRAGLCAGPPPRRGARVPGRRPRRSPAGAGPVRADARWRRRSPARPRSRSATPGGRRASGRTSAGGRPAPGWRGDLANGRGGPLGPTPSAAAWDTASDRWTDERLAAERARTLRRLGRWPEAAEAWQAAAAAGGGLGAIAWIEVAKLREHRFDDPGGALAATRAAWRLLERLRATGRAHPRLEADLQRRGTRLAHGSGRQGLGPPRLTRESGLRERAPTPLEVPLLSALVPRVPIAVARRRPALRAPRTRPLIVPVHGRGWRLPRPGRARRPRRVVSRQAPAAYRLITVSQELVQAQVEAALANPTIGRSLRSNSAIDTFRERTRMRLLSEAVRGAVIPSPQISDTDVERELMADASTNGDPQDVEAAIRTRLSAKATGEAWVRWLGSRRACASVVILDAGLALPPTAAYACD